MEPHGRGGQVWGVGNVFHFGRLLPGHPDPAEERDGLPKCSPIV